MLDQVTDSTAKWRRVCRRLRLGEATGLHQDFVYRINDVVKYGGTAYGFVLAEHTTVALGASTGLAAVRYSKMGRLKPRIRIQRRIC